MKVLVIDDDFDVIDIVTLAFETRLPDAVVIAASNGESGVEMARTESPNVVILDIGLPDMDGFAVCQEIRKFSDVPVVILTVRDTESDIAKGLDVGADEYLTKPFRPIEFLARVQSVMRRAQAEDVQRHLNQQLEDRNRELEQRVREITALNELFQQHLQQRSEVGQAAMQALSKLQELFKETNSLAEMSQPQDLAHFREVLAIEDGQPLFGSEARALGEKAPDGNEAELQ